MKQMKNKSNRKRTIMRQPVADSVLKFKDHAELLNDLKEFIRNARTKAVFATNREMILLYMDMDKEILLRQKTKDWRNSVVEKLSNDLKYEFPDMKGISPRNLRDMHRFVGCDDGAISLY
jgi:hypothetical protein